MSNSNDRWFATHVRMASSAMHLAGARAADRRYESPTSLYAATRWARSHFGRGAPSWTTVRARPEVLLQVVLERMRSGNCSPVVLGLVPDLHGNYGIRVVREVLQRIIADHAESRAISVSA